LGFEHQSGLLVAVWSDGTIVRARSERRPYGRHVVGRLLPPDYERVKAIVDASPIWEIPSGGAGIDTGFEVLTQPEGRWPKLCHRETGIEIDVLPEGGRPGTASRPAPTVISHPKSMGAIRGKLKYVSLAHLIELKLAAGRLRDEADVLELARENRDRVAEIRTHLAAVHPQYDARFEELLVQLDEPAAD
jgi:hypothetical protein